MAQLLERIRAIRNRMADISVAFAISSDKFRAHTESFDRAGTAPA